MSRRKIVDKRGWVPISARIPEPIKESFDTKIVSLPDEDRENLIADLLKYWVEGRIKIERLRKNDVEV